jgi:hypothetical protein
MRWTIRILSGLVVMTFGYVWTVGGQSGLTGVNPNLCDLWTDTFGPLLSCHFNILGLYLWGAGAAIAAIFLSCEFLQFLRSPKKKDKDGSYLEIMDAIWWVAEQSAWGRWQDAQCYASGSALVTENKLRNAEFCVLEAAQNNDLQISGRIRGETNYNPIDQHFWRIVFFSVQPDHQTLWSATLTPRSGITTLIPDYDSFIVSRSQHESLWPQRALKIEWLIVKLLVSSKLKALIAVVKRVEPSHLA